MLRVAYLFERFPSFGQTFCYREVAELLRQGTEVTIFSIRHPTGEPAQDWDPEIVARVHYLPEEPELTETIDRDMRAGNFPSQATAAIRKWGRRTDFLRLYQAAYVGQQLRELGIDRVHAHFAGMAARTAYWLGEFFGIRYSLTVHANDIFVARDFEIGLEQLIERAVAIVAVSDFAVEHLRARFPAAGGKVLRVYNGVELARFSLAQFEAAVPLIISVGRLIEKKGFRDLIAACELLKRSGSPFRCQIIGDGPLEAELRGQIADADLSAEVQLTGPLPQSEIAARLAAAHVFVLACTAEVDGGMDNLPTVIMEAMASGLPVISTPLAGIPEMIEPGSTGEMVAANDPVALSTAIARILSQPAEARRLGARGRELAARKFSVETNVRALAEILSQK